MDSVVHGDDDLCVWDGSDPQSDPPDKRYPQPDAGWTWQTDLDGWQQHPEVLQNHTSNADNIERLKARNTSIVETH